MPNPRPMGGPGGRNRHGYQRPKNMGKTIKRLMEYLGRSKWLLLLVAGADRLQAGLDLRRMGSRYWAGTVAAALVTLILGAVVLANPFDTALLLIRFIGVSLLVVGCVGLGSSIMVSRMVRSFYADRFDDPSRPLEVEAVDVTDSREDS